MFNLLEMLSTRHVLFIDSIWDFVQRMLPLQTWIDAAYDFVSELAYWEQLVFGILGLFIVILGIIAFVKKLSKLLIVVAILVGVWLLYHYGVFGG